MGRTVTTKRWYVTWVCSIPRYDEDTGSLYKCEEGYTGKAIVAEAARSLGSGRHVPKVQLYCPRCRSPLSVESVDAVH